MFGMAKKEVKIGKLAIFLISLIILIFPLVSAAHYIVGYVNDALDGTSANGYEVVLWNPANGIDDNLTDIIGPAGNSGTDNTYFIDCELLNTPCAVGDEIRVRVLNNGSNYITGFVNITVTGAGYDTMPNLTLNSPPNATLDSPINYANLSNSEVNFSCTANDLDGNLANVTLYGNWSGGWHANETLTASGSSDTINFSKTLAEGVYEWNCLATDNLSISGFAEQNFTFTLDLTPPNISSIYLNATGNVCGTSDYVRVNCTATDSLSGIGSVLIEAIKPSGALNYTAQLLSGDTYYADILLDEIGTWNFNCIANDSANNIANKSALESIEVYSSLADLSISSGNITFSNTNPLENQEVIINATIFNNGCGDANNFLVGFYEDDPDSGGRQINGNKTASVPGLGNSTVNVTWNAKIGTTNVFVSVDLNNSITEENESNNKANNSINVTAWQDFYGNITIDKLLADQNRKNLSVWSNESSLTGNIFITDTESNIDWFSLQAIGKNASGGNTANDFSDIDSILNMNNFSDSVSNTFTSDGNTPVKTDDFFIYKNTISSVPISNSTNNTNFITGILWDMSDDSNGEYDQADKEDLVFVTKINRGTSGAYGIYDYEISIPVRLREYNPADTNNIFIYFDLN